MSVIRKILTMLTRGIIRLFYELEIRGIENIPATGPAILAPNHVNYIDAPLLLSFSSRPVYFVAASNAFAVPVWRTLMRLFGAIPVERGKADASAIKTSLGVLEHGDVLGIFPEGSFTTDGHTTPAKQGAAYLAMKSGAPIVPVTIAGAFHSWPRLGPRKRSLPRPWKLVVTFHEPIRISEEERQRHARDKAFAENLSKRVMDTLNRTLEPAIRAEEKIDHLLAGPAAHIRLYELFPLFLSVAAAFLMGLRTNWFSGPATFGAAWSFLTGFLALGALYFVYLLLDRHMWKQNALTRALRSLSPFFFLLFYYPLFVHGIPLVTQVDVGPVASYPAWFADLLPPFRWIAVDWLFISYYIAIPHLLISLRYYHFHKYLLFQRFMRGILLTLYAGLLSVILLPTVGDWYPLAVSMDSMGLLAPFLSTFQPVRLVVGSFPAIVVTITAFLAVFDFLHRRGMFFTMLFPSTSAVLSPVLLRGYPLGAVTLDILLVLVVFGYMRLFPMTAHDGREI